MNKKRNPPKKFTFKKSTSKEIGISGNSKVNEDEMIYDPIIQKDENGIFTVVKMSKDIEIDVELNEDDPKFSAFPRLVS